MSETIVNSSGNVFIDLGYSPDEAAILQIRADLMADLRKFIKAKRLTQAKAAEILGISQSRVSDSIRGKWERFSLGGIRGHLTGRYVGTEEEADDGIPFDEKMKALTSKLAEQFAKGSELEKTIHENLKGIWYEF